MAISTNYDNVINWKSKTDLNREDIKDLNSRTLILEPKILRNTAELTATGNISETNILTLLNASADLTATLPSAVGLEGYVLNIKRKDNTASVVTVDTVNSEKIDDATSVVLAFKDNLCVISDNIQWYVI